MRRSALLLFFASVALAAETVDAEIIRDLDFFMNYDVVDSPVLSPDADVDDADAILESDAGEEP